MNVKFCAITFRVATSVKLLQLASLAAARLVHARQALFQDLDLAPQGEMDAR